MSITILVLRKNKPNINRVIGDVIDIISSYVYEGKEVEKIGDNYVRVIVTDVNIDNPLVDELKGNIKRLKSPDISDPFYQELLSTGLVTTTLSTLNNYLVLV